MPDLIVIDGPHRGQRQKIESDEFFIGRDTTNNFQLVDEKISRRHCKIERHNDTYIIIDLNSRNGTFVNGIQIKKPKELQSGDEIVAGDSVLIFSYESSKIFDENISIIPAEETRIVKDFILPGGHTKFVHQRGNNIDELIKANRYLSTLYEAGKAINSIHDTGKLLNKILELVLEVVDADRGAIISIDPETNELIPKSVKSKNKEAKQTLDVPVSRSIIKQVWSQGDAVLCSDVTVDPRFKNQESIITSGIHSAIYAPLIGKNEILGVLIVDNVSSVKRFTEEDLNLLSAIGNIAGIALENSKFHEELKQQNENLKKSIALEHQIVASSKEMEKVLEMISKVAPTDSTVLIRGESGTGKELVAKAIHYNSKRKDKPLIGVNCAALAPNLMESELFGHEKGAFTTAISRNIGRFELANGGTLFLDEIGELSLDIQVKLLRVLEEREFQRVGGSKTIKCNVRLIAATNADLEKAVSEGRFREDLYYRLQVIQIFLPPLRERIDDIPILTKYFLNKFNKEIGRSFKKVSAEAMELMKKYHWPGNIRELRNALERAVVLGSGDTLLPEHLPLNIHRGGIFNVKEPSVPCSLKEMEKKHIIEVLNYVNWNKKSASTILGIDRSTLYEKLKLYDIKQ